MLRSMDHRRDKNAPRDFLHKERLEFDQSPEIRILNMRIGELTTTIAGEPAKHPALFKERQRLYDEKRVLRRSTLKTHREKWFSASYGVEALRQLQLGEEDDEILARPQPTSTFPLIRNLIPERNRMANSILVAKDLRSEEGQAALRDIYSLCIDDNRVAYRPDERPMNGVCPCNGCSTVMTE
jgi:hypothetical protein